MKGESKSFANVSIFFSESMVVEHDICDHDLRKEIKILIKLLFLFSKIVYNIMKLLAKVQVKAG